MKMIEIDRGLWVQASSITSINLISFASHKSHQVRIAYGDGELRCVDFEWVAGTQITSESKGVQAREYVNRIIGQIESASMPHRPVLINNPSPWDIPPVTSKYQVPSEPYSPQVWCSNPASFIPPFEGES